MRRLDGQQLRWKSQPIPNAGFSIDVATYHYENMRTGQYTHETVLTNANVNPAKFGKLGAFMVDGKVDAQPLYLSSPFPVRE